MSKTNCINCGAAKDTDEIKCPFCGTTYLDFTSIDFASDDPVVCQFVLPNNITIDDSKAKAVMSMLARPRLETMSIEANSTTMYGRFGMPMATFTTGYDVNIGVSFQPIARKDKTLFTLRALEE